MRAKIVRNKILAKFAVHYAFGPRLKVHPSQEALLRETESVLAGTFEAYVGGLYSDYGIEGYTMKIQPWLSSLLTPYVKKAYDEALAEHPSPGPNSPATARGYWAQLNEKLFKMGSVVEWKEESLSARDPNGEGGLLWNVEAIVDGQVIGAGSGLNKKTAKNIAAYHALETLASA